jgi:hypothetical protein
LASRSCSCMSLLTITLPLTRKIHSSLLGGPCCRFLRSVRRKF